MVACSVLINSAARRQIRLRPLPARPGSGPQPRNRRRAFAPKFPRFGRIVGHELEADRAVIQYRPEFEHDLQCGGDGFSNPAIIFLAISTGSTSISSRLHSRTAVTLRDMLSASTLHSTRAFRRLFTGPVIRFSSLAGCKLTHKPLDLLPRAPAPCFNFFGFRHPPTSTNSAAKW